MHIGCYVLLIIKCCAENNINWGGFGSEGMDNRYGEPIIWNDGKRRALAALRGKYGNVDPYRPMVGDEYQTDLSAASALIGIPAGRLERMLYEPNSLDSQV